MTEAATAGGKARLFSVELDGLRGIAGLLMIVNHAGFRLLSGADAVGSASGWAVFLGSFAPVLFFFATGVGVGLAPRAGLQGAAALRSLFIKAGLLVLADQFMFWRSGVAWGIDFFGFIALSTIVVTLLARVRHTAAWALVLAGAVIVLRFGIGPQVASAETLPSALAWVLGVRGLPDISYPLAPWLVYPLLGLVGGRAYAALGASPAVALARWARPAAYLAAALVVVSLAFGAIGASFFRWGTVGAGYVPLSGVVLVAVIVLTGWIGANRPGWWRRLALPGVASFAVIPLHFGLLDLFDSVFAVPVSQPIYLLATAAIVCSSFVLSRALAGALDAPFARRHAAGLLVASLVATASSAAVVIGASNSSAHRVALAVVIGQMSIAMLLGLRRRRVARDVSIAAG